MTYKTEQESFWASEFGSEYVNRNQVTEALHSTGLAFWTKVLALTNSRPASFLELGANIGRNLRALHDIFGSLARLDAVEINPDAAACLRQWGKASVHETSMLEFDSQDQWDFVFTSGVLIHINPASLPDIYRRMHRLSRRYIMVNEYYNPTPVEVPYRGHAQRLFKRDFAGELMEMFPDLSVRGYGFFWRRDPVFPGGDDCTWFLLEKR
ncbi:pseudaminic acid biosynthesis-associated methylase [Desulfocurvibacter africanus]|uniref:pseudaminic acid biosynthesis-associated methylase n=1 Tax=Desulfocurvibacter africanus TaxID=873 RepID=UPI002FD8FE85